MNAPFLPCLIPSSPGPGYLGSTGARYATRWSGGEA